MRAHRALLPALATAALLLGGACSSDGSDGATTTTSPSSTTADRSTTTEGDDDPTTTIGVDATTSTTTTPDADEPVDEDEQAYVDALQASIEDSELSSSIESGQAACLAEGFVRGVGADNLAAQGVTPEEFAGFGGIEGPAGLELDEDTANELFDVYGECEFDLLELFSASDADELTPEEQACVDAVFTEDNLRRSFVASVTGQELEDDPLLEAIGCVDIAGADAPTG